MAEANGFTASRVPAAAAKLPSHRSQRAAQLQGHAGDAGAIHRSGKWLLAEALEHALER
jgi:hypothetical protein